MIFPCFQIIRNDQRLKHLAPKLENIHSIDEAVKVLGEIAELSALSF